MGDEMMGWTDAMATCKSQAPPNTYTLKLHNGHNQTTTNAIKYKRTIHGHTYTYKDVDTCIDKHTRTPT